MHMKRKKMASRFYRQRYLDSGALASSPPSCLLIYGRLVEHASPLRPRLPASPPCSCVIRAQVAGKPGDRHPLACPGDKLARLSQGLSGSHLHG